MRTARDHEFRALKRLLGLTVLAFVALAFTTTGTNTADSRVPSTTRRVAHEQLQIDTSMIERMSTPNADTDRQNHRTDEQLARAQNAGYLAALERHQADIDRMLARP
jgi:hypothetical protein